jgi:hypothetical protein
VPCFVRDLGRIAARAPWSAPPAEQPALAS